MAAVTKAPGRPGRRWMSRTCTRACLGPVVPSPVDGTRGNRIASHVSRKSAPGVHARTRHPDRYHAQQPPLLRFSIRPSSYPDQHECTQYRNPSPRLIRTIVSAGQQRAEATTLTAERHRAPAWTLRWLGSRWQGSPPPSRHGLPSTAGAGSTGATVRHPSGRAASSRWSRMSGCLPCRSSPCPRPPSASARPVSGIRCPHLPCPHRGGLVKRVGAAGSPRLERAGFAWSPAVSASGSVVCRVRRGEDDADEDRAGPAGELSAPKLAVVVGMRSAGGCGLHRLADQMGEGGARTQARPGLVALSSGSAARRSLRRLGSGTASRRPARPAGGERPPCGGAAKNRSRSARTRRVCWMRSSGRPHRSDAPLVGCRVQTALAPRAARKSPTSTIRVAVPTGRARPSAARPGRRGPAAQRSTAERARTRARPAPVRVAAMPAP